MCKLLNRNKFYDEKVIKEAIKLILDMLNYDSEKRPSAELCKQYKFLENIK